MLRCQSCCFPGLLANWCLTLKRNTVYLAGLQVQPIVRHFGKVLIYTLVVVAAVAVLISVLFLPVLQIYGTSMTPTLSEGDIVVSVKGADFESGDLIASIWATRSWSSAASQGLASGWISTKREMYT
ncbi:MAG: S24/S26 family peptidase [Lachnospiraceae bacterium]|nr:S24/S26 family peptidase [Lachnospiraceae bacterium]